MLGCKVFLTYKRKRLTSNSHTHGNECRNLCDKLINKKPSKDEGEISSMQNLSGLELEKDLKDDMVGSSSTKNGLENNSLEPSKKRKTGFGAPENLTVPKTSSMEISDSLSEDKPGDLCRDTSEITKFKAPLITFVRRCKRKRITEVGDMVSHEAASNLKPQEEVHQTGDVALYDENKIPDVVSTCAYTEPALDSEVLNFEGEKPVVDLNSSSDGLNKDNNAHEDLSTCCLGISLNNAVKDSSSNNKGVAEKPAKEDSDREASHPFLDLSITRTDSSGTVDWNAYLESNSQRRSVPVIHEALLGSMDSTSRSHASVLRQKYPPEMLFGESSSTQNSHLCPDSCAFMKGPVTMDFFPKNNCLQLFGEARAEETTRSVLTRSEAINSAPKIITPPFLGLTQPTRPKTSRFACNNSFTTFPFSNPVDETLESSLESSSSQLTSLLRHKSVHTKLKLYNSSWTEEELDSLWVGVRRYGRKNWNVMIRDPRLRFSSWRVARDLAEQWEEEQSKLLQNATVGTCREITAEETRLSLGDVYNNSCRERKVSRRARFKAKAPSTSAKGLPHWLREAVFSSPASWRQPPPVVPAGCTFRRNEAQGYSGGDHHLGSSSDVIVIESDVSSEETISDDRNARQ